MKPEGMHIQLFSIHGLIRGNSPELGRDADTGGQVKYVLELARALGERPEVVRVDLVTRLVADKAVSSDYSRPIEPLSEKVRLVRIQCGGRKYMRKELLWPYLDEMIDRCLKFYKTEGRIPDIFHGHYADGGYVAKELAHIFDLPFIFTGHSMGRHKKEKLLGEGFSTEEINRRYNIDYRIEMEEEIIREAELVVVSTTHERQKQYGLYDNYQTGNFRVIPPGIDIGIFFPYYDLELEIHRDDQVSKQARIALIQELHRFWVNPGKPFILALCRPDQRKNIGGLVTAYGEDKELQAIANLAIFAGIRKNILEMEENEQKVLTEMLLLMDRFDLYGKLAIPKKHDFSLEVPELYRMCAASRGVFVNPALVEPFGLTLIEAASCGLPIIATRDGGPRDILDNCRNGFLVDPARTREIAIACRKLLVERKLWKSCSANGINCVRQNYSWSRHSESLLESIKRIVTDRPEQNHRAAAGAVPYGRRFTGLKRLIITDVDNTLVGAEQPMVELLELLERKKQQVGWGVATGRNLELTKEVLSENGIPTPDVIISSVGTEIFYGPKVLVDAGWQQHLRYRWKPELILEVLRRMPFLQLQEEGAQRPFKISYYVDPGKDPDFLPRVHQALRGAKLCYHLVFSHGQFLDILPCRASKGKAIRYLSYKWELPLQHIMVCGDSGNDADMLRDSTCGVVVANYSEELEKLKGFRRTYFSGESYAGGILDGIAHYRLLEGLD